MVKNSGKNALPKVIEGNVSKIEWPDFTFPPINLWNMQLHGEIVQLLSQRYYERYKDLLDQ